MQQAVIFQKDVTHNETGPRVARETVSDLKPAPLHAVDQYRRAAVDNENGVARLDYRENFACNGFSRMNIVSLCSDEKKA